MSAAVAVEVVSIDRGATAGRGSVYSAHAVSVVSAGAPERQKAARREKQ